MPTRKSSWMAGSPLLRNVVLPVLSRLPSMKMLPKPVIAPTPEPTA
jgi:hypothetical protein